LKICDGYESVSTGLYSRVRAECVVEGKMEACWIYVAGDLMLRKRPHEWTMLEEDWSLDEYTRN
jgi:hypothetical protein